MDRTNRSQPGAPATGGCAPVAGAPDCDQASALSTEVADYLRREGIASGTTIVACSGGPDSLALLRAMQLTLPPHLRLVAAHFNHQLRGAASDADEAFVVEFGRRSEIAIRVGRDDVGRRAVEAGANLEATARRLRYEWLARIASEEGAAWIATGHTADDQAETVLHHLIRGTRLRGLRGIAPRRPAGPAIDLVRPLLTVSRAQVMAFLDSEALVARQDATNSDPRLTRSCIRHELLPLLKERFNPEVVAVLCRLAIQAQRSQAEWERLGREALIAAERPRAAEMVIVAAPVLGRHPSHVIQEVFHLIWEREGWPLGEMGHAEWMHLAALVAGSEAAHDFPGGVRGRRKRDVVQLWRMTKQ